MITAYHLYINEGSNGTPMHEITDYDNVSGTYTVTAGDTIGAHTVSVGNTYTFKYVAENDVGVSLDSELLYATTAR